jgi:hypothetical protein
MKTFGGRIGRAGMRGWDGMECIVHGVALDDTQVSLVYTAEPQKLLDSISRMFRRLIQPKI